MIMENYSAISANARDFIHDGEIRATLEYASTHRNDIVLINEILEKASLGKGLNHREAMVLLECNDTEITDRIYSLARAIKQRIYGNRIVMFAPYLVAQLLHCEFLLVIVCDEELICF